MTRPHRSILPQTPVDILADNQGKRIAILIVAYNAVTTLADVLKRIPDQVWANVEEVVVFDDASVDNTYELAVGYKTVSRLQNLTVIRNEQNLGYGGNQKLGYKYLIEKNYDVVVLLHGDGQYAPEILSHLYAPIVSGYADAVFGSRMMPDYGGPMKGGMPLYKYVGNRILSVMENRALGMNLTEFHSGYRAYNLHALREINFTHMTNDFHFDTEIIIKMHHQKMRIMEVPIPTYYGDEICYVNGMKYAADVTRAIVRYNRTTHGLQKYQEYQEYFPHYPIKQGKGSSHNIFLELAGENRDILDIGCGDGYFAAELVRKGNRVVGIDILKSPSVTDGLEAYYSVDLDHRSETISSIVRRRRFDLILLQDVLEHLQSPERLLRECKELLKPGGLVLVSVPNIANITVRCSLLLGKFEYTERGILDKTHVRFFTRRSAQAFLEKHGYRVKAHRMSVMPVELALGLDPSSGPMKVINRLLRSATPVLPGLLGYQSILVASPREAVSDLLDTPNGRHTGEQSFVTAAASE